MIATKLIEKMKRMATMSDKNLEKKSWWKRRWIRVVILLIVFGVLVLLEQQPSTNSLGANVVILNAIVGIWLWIEIIIGFVTGVVWAVKKLPSKDK